MNLRFWSRKPVNIQVSRSATVDLLADKYKIYRCGGCGDTVRTYHEPLEKCTRCEGTFTEVKN